MADSSLSGLQVARELDRIIEGRGKPFQNAFIENFNGRLRDELLNETLFSSLTCAWLAHSTRRYDSTITAHTEALIGSPLTRALRPSNRDTMRCCAAAMAPHRNPPRPPRTLQPKIAGANSKLDKIWGNITQSRCLPLSSKRWRCPAATRNEIVPECLRRPEEGKGLQCWAVDRSMENDPEAGRLD